MAEFRQIYCHIWRDNWFIDLTPEEKLLYIYLFSNSSTSASGIYEMPLKVIAFETGLPQEKVSSIISDFQNVGKVYYEDGIIWIPKMRSYQESSQSPKLQKRIQQDIDRIPSGKIKSMYLSHQDRDGKEIMDRVSIPYQENIKNADRVSIPYQENAADTDTDTDTETETETDTGGTGAGIANSPILERSYQLKEKDPAAEAAFSKIIKAYESEIGVITKVISDKIQSYLDDSVNPQWIIDAIRISSENNARRWSYVEGILKRWIAQGNQNDYRQKVDNTQYPSERGWSTV